MLRVMRHAAGSWVVKILFVVLILSFLGWGVSGVVTAPSQDMTVADVGPVKITVPQLAQAFDQQVERLRQAYGESFDAAQARQLGVLDQTLRQVIDRTLYGLAARDLGLEVNEQSVLREIGGMPGFRTPDGKFDRAKFDAVLSSAGLTEQNFVQERRQDIANTDLLGALQGGVFVPDTLVQALYRHRNETRTAETVLVPAAAFTDIPPPDDATLAGFEKQKADRFSTPEYRALTVVPIAIASLAKDITVTDADLHAAYDARPDAFIVPRNRDLEEVTVPDEAKAKAIAAAVQGGKTLAEAAKDNGAEVQSLSGTAAADLPPELAKPVFDQPVGKVGEPVKSSLGWIVVSVTADHPETHKPLDAVKDELTRQIKTGKATDQAATLANKLDDARTGGATLEEAARRLSLPLVKVAAVDKAGKGPDGILVDGVPSLPVVVETAFKLDKGGISPVTETPADGGFTLVRVDAVTPPALKPLDQVRDQVAAAWIAEQKAKRAADKAAAMVAAIKGGRSLDAVAHDAGYAVTTAPAVTRAASGTADLPAALVPALFTIKTGEIVSGPGPAGTVIARLKAIDVPDPGADNPGVEKIKGEVTRQMVGDVLAQYALALRNRYPVTVHQQTIDSRFGASG